MACVAHPKNKPPGQFLGELLGPETCDLAWMALKCIR